MADMYEHMQKAETILQEYQTHDSTITDEAELLRGCLHALIALTKHFYGL